MRARRLIFFRQKKPALGRGRAQYVEGVAGNDQGEDAFRLCAGGHADWHARVGHQSIEHLVLIAKVHIFGIRKAVKAAAAGLSCMHINQCAGVGDAG